MYLLPSTTWAITGDHYDLSIFVNYNIAYLKLILTSVVELNPGPSDFERILKGIKKIEDKVLTQIMSVKTEISDIKKNISSIRDDHIKLRPEVKDTGENQAIYDEALKVTNQKVEFLCVITENLRLDTDHLNNIAEAYNGSVLLLKDEAERLNVKTISTIILPPTSLLYSLWLK